MDFSFLEIGVPRISLFQSNSSSSITSEQGTDDALVVVEGVLLYTFVSLTCLIGCICFLISLVSYILYHKDYDNHPVYIVKGCCKPSVLQEIKDTLKLCGKFIEWTLDFIGIIFVFLAGLFPYSHYSDDGSSTPYNIEDPFDAVVYFGIVTIALGAYGFVVPPFLVTIYQIQGSKESEVFFASFSKAKKVITIIWTILKWLLFTVSLKVALFLLTYYAKTIIALCIIYPWRASFDLMEKSGIVWGLFFLFWAMIISLLIITCFTVQGLWASAIPAIIEAPKKKGVISMITYIILHWFLYTIRNILFIFLCLPQMIELKMKRPKNFQEWIVSIPVLKFFVTTIGNNNEELNEFLGDPDIISWSCFCSRYSYSFITPIPFIGPYLFLVATMFARSGFWMQQYWSHVRKSNEVLEAPIKLSGHKNAVKDGTADIEGGKALNGSIYYTTKERVKDSKPATQGFYKILNSFYISSGDYGIDKVVNKDNEAGGVILLRYASMILIPFISLFALIPYFTHGFDMLQFLWHLKDVYVDPVVST